MAYDDAEQLEAFRTDTRKWLEANCPRLDAPMLDDEVVWGVATPHSRTRLETLARPDGRKGWTARMVEEYGGGG